MKIVSFIDQDERIERILSRLGLWDTCLRATHRQARNHDPPAKKNLGSTMSIFKFDRQPLSTAAQIPVQPIQHVVVYFS